MSAPIPKPAPRPRKPAKRIRRSGGHRGRRTSEHRRESLAQKKLADRLWSFLVLEGVERCAFSACALPPGQAHHMIYRSRSPKSRWIVANGVPLCVPMHRFIHSTVEGAYWNRSLCRSRLGDKWIDAVTAMPGYGDTAAEAVVRLRAEVRARGLEAAARERGLMDDGNEEG